MRTFETTLRRSTAWIEGETLDRTATARIRLVPAEPGEGIRFRRIDGGNDVEIPVAPDHVRSMPRWTSFEYRGAWIHHAEHVLAAIAIAGLDHAIIEVDGDRVPMVDGGRARPFYDAISEAGIIQSGIPRKVFALRETVYYADDRDTEGRDVDRTSSRGGRYVAAMPAARLHVTYTFDWFHMPSLPSGVAEFDEGERDGEQAALDARSYLVGAEMAEVEPLLGDVRNRVMRLDPGCDVRLAREAAHHKIIDFIGDMMAAGRPVTGRFLLYRTGHRIHHEFLKRLLSTQALVLKESECS